MATAYTRAGSGSGERGWIIASLFRDGLIEEVRPFYYDHAEVRRAAKAKRTRR